MRVVGLLVRTAVGSLIGLLQGLKQAQKEGAWRKRTNPTNYMIAGGIAAATLARPPSSVRAGAVRGALLGAVFTPDIDRVVVGEVEQDAIRLDRYLWGAVGGLLGALWAKLSLARRGR